ncbi:hypothetical protein [Mesorhizobium sp.]|uniref:tetratricopeptide repeat protein n=1 Tax=Mesorhizobium sp. TaxID=1871066 RepID=UPI0025F5208F|nr:hypothetical protein [Mesorhizobium sp.]
MAKGSTKAAFSAQAKTMASTIQHVCRPGARRHHYRKALTLDPNNAWAWARHGWIAIYKDEPARTPERFPARDDAEPDGSVRI